MDRASLVAEPVIFDACDRLEAQHGLTPLEAARKTIACGLSRLRQVIEDRHELNEELNELSVMVAEEAEAVLQKAAH